MRATAEDAGLSRMKSTAEGSEIRLTWPATVPGVGGTVTAISAERIDTVLSTGRKQPYRLARKGKRPLIPCVKPGDTFGNDDTIIASLMPALISTTAPSVPQYDFIADLRSEQLEDVYAAVKALGFLPDQAHRDMALLEEFARAHRDPRIKLEAAASLARLGAESGWEQLEVTAYAQEGDLAYRMENAFILSELRSERSTELLSRIATSQENTSELRAAAAWGLSNDPENLTKLLPLVSDADELTSVHAIVGTGRLIQPANVAFVLQSIDGNQRKAAGLVRALLSSKCDYLGEALAQLQSVPAGPRRQWLLYLLAATGRNRCESIIKSTTPDLLTELEFFWSHHTENWTNRLDVADQINYLEQQRE